MFDMLRSNMHCLNLIFCFFSGGRNGYGAKLCNIFSSKFTVETQSNEYKKAFKQVRKLQFKLQ